MIIVTLVATLAAAMVWQQWRAVQVESAERARVQARWILAGSLDFAKLILREDARSKTGQTMTALTEPWATPLAESRLSTFLAIDKANPDDGPEAFLSGNIVDAQARFNIANLVGGNKPDLESARVLERLCQTAGIDVGVAGRIANGWLNASASKAEGATPLLPVKVSQLVWLGIDRAAAEALEPYVTVLPEVTPVNVNTASKEVLAAVENIDPATAERLVQIRQRTPFKDRDSFKKLLPRREPVDGEAPVEPNIDIRSSYFDVRGRLRLVDHVLIERSLLHRRQQNLQFEVLWRERIASLEQTSN